MGRAHFSIRRQIRRLLLLGIALAWTGGAIAADVRFAGSAGYSHLSTLVALNADKIQNNSPTSSAAVRMELWATPAPFTGVFSGGYQLAAYGVGPLAGGAALTNVSSGVLPWTEPPAGTWQVTMVLTEQVGGAVNGGYVARHWIGGFPTITGKGSPPPVDTTPPTASIASPASGNVSGTITVSANATDNVGVTRVDFYINGAKVGSDSAAPWQYSWNTTTQANGNATLRAVAVDAAGNSGQSALVTVNVANVVAPPVDTTPPTASIASPTGGNVSGTVTVNANAADNVGVSRVEFYVNGSLVGTDAAAPYQYSWNTAALANGSATLSAKAFDAAGNSAQSAAVSVTVANVVAPPPDTTKPTVSIASPITGKVVGTVTVSANAADNVGVTRVDFYVNGTLASSDSASPYQYSWNTAAIANGSATLYAKAFDAAGNSAQSAAVTVTVANVVAPPPLDTTKPTISIASPTSGNVSGTVTIAANASDNVGVAWVYLLVNGNIMGTASKAPWSFAWNSRSVINGAAKIEMFAMDAAGNLGLSAPVYVTVANALAPASLKLAVEYYNEDLDHYFITAKDDEIGALDAGNFAGWYRTGSSIDVYESGSAEGSPVCRFYMPPEDGDSHFYSATKAECEQVAQKFPRFAFESTEVFRVVTPDLETGQCPQSMVPMYRLWNNRADSNHRYTSDRQTRDEMVAKGYVAEGYGPDAVIMCGTP
jgi:hypothetical protein